MKIEYLYGNDSSPMFNEIRFYGHREGLYWCPDCGERLEWDEWYTKDTVLQVLLDHFANVKDSVIVISECPKCHEPSWVHYTLDWIDSHYDVFDEEKIEAEKNKRIENAKEEWDNSKCKTCKNLTDDGGKSYKIKYGRCLHCEVKRKDGSGCSRSGPPEKKCEDYEMII